MLAGHQDYLTNQVQQSWAGSHHMIPADQLPASLKAIFGHPLADYCCNMAAYIKMEHVACLTAMFIFWTHDICLACTHSVNVADCAYVSMRMTC